MQKHAYLIMAHNHFGLLKKLLGLLDDARNDFYIHIDRGARGVDLEDIRSAVRQSPVVFVPRIRVRWGGYSMVRCEVQLLDAAVRHGGYAYYHLLSGVDLPLKTPDEICRFFAQNEGYEFVHIDPNPVKPADRIRYYYPLQDIMGHHRRSLTGFLLSYPQKLLLFSQKLLKVDRLRGKGVQVAKGANWFSITEECARYVVSRKDWIEETFRYSHCADELFLQMLLVDTPFEERLYRPGEKSRFATMRLTDWNRGYPYTWRAGDYGELDASECLFARKFDPALDPVIIDMLCARLRREGKPLC